MRKVYKKSKVPRLNDLVKMARFGAAIFFLWVTGFQASAQERTISGTITSSEDGEALPGVTILVKGTTNGTITDIDGNYKIGVSDGDVLVVSFVGFKPQEVEVGGRTSINVNMEADVTALEEVVVIGYGTQKKSDLTGAISSLNREKLLGQVTASVDQALQGRLAGVQVTQNSGAPGGAVSIRIRGTSSLTGSNEPLYVIDGVRVGGGAQGITGFDWQGGAGGQQQAAVNPLASLNPNDIESIDVLKDASATAIYGSQASNGVVIITTKRGKRGEAKVSYNGYYAVQEVYKTFDLMDLPEYADYYNEVSREVGQNEDARFADPSLLGPGTDWQEAIFQVAPMQSHTITATGGTENTTFMISGGYFAQEGIVIGSKFDRFNVRTNVQTELKDWLTIGTNLALSRKDETITLQDGGDGVISQAAQMAPHIPVRNFDGSFAGPEQGNQSANIGSNPVGLALLRNNTVLSNQVMSNTYLNVSILKGLDFRTEVSANYNNNTNVAFQPTYEWGQISNPTSRLGNSLSQGFFWSWTNYATFNRTFGNHNLTVMAGTEALRNRFDGFTAFKFNVPNDLPVMNQGDQATELNTGYKGWNALTSYMARANYSFSDRYLLTATIRRDGSTRFGPGNRWGWFPSASAAWRISEEPFMPTSSVLTNLKLRLGWGLVGNQEIGEYRFGSALTTEITGFGQGVRNSAYSNPLLKWESTEMINLGADVELFQGRAELIAEAYIKNTDDLLLQVTLPGTFGSRVGGPYANVGSMENKGIEITLNTVNMDMGKFRWNTSANFSLNRNKVTKLVGNDLTRALYWYTGFETATRTTVGRPVGQFYGYVMEGIFTSKEEIENHATQVLAPGTTSEGDPGGQNLIERSTGVWLGDIKWKDINGDGVIDTDDQTFIGDPNPDWSFGFSNTFTYGPFTLDVNVIGSIGGDILNYSRARNEQMYYRFDNQAATVVNRARIELIDPENGDLSNIDDVQLVNPDTNIPRFDNGTENKNFYMSSRWVEDGTYVRIQNVRLAFLLPASITNTLRIDRLQVYANVQNLATFTDYTGLDPQIGAFNQDALYQSVDMGRYPLPRLYTLGVDIDF